MKNRSLFLCVVALLAAACSSKTTTSAPTSCDPAQRVGTYRATFVEESGTCGPVNSQLVSLNGAPGSGVGNGCTLNSERWSEGNCKLERDISCSAPDVGPFHIVIVSRAETADGSELSGTETISFTGRDPCTSTYALDFVRQ